MKKVYLAKQFARVTLVVMMMIFSLSGLQAQTNRVDETRMVTLNIQKASVREILDEIQKQTGVTFSYESSLLSGLQSTDGLPDAFVCESSGSVQDDRKRSGSEA